jgi:hypothetical protein
VESVAENAGSIHLSSRLGLSQNVKASVTADGQSATIDFYIAGRRHQYQLSLFSIFSDDATAVAHTESGAKQLETRALRSFKSRLDGKWASAYVHDDMSVTGIFEDGGFLIELEPHRFALDEDEPDPDVVALLDIHRSTGQDAAHVVWHHALSDLPRIFSSDYQRGDLPIMKQNNSEVDLSQRQTRFDPFLPAPIANGSSDSEESGQWQTAGAGRKKYRLAVDKVSRGKSKHGGFFNDGFEYDLGSQDPVLADPRIATNDSLGTSSFGGDPVRWWPGCFASDFIMHKFVVGVLVDYPAFKRLGRDASKVKSIIEKTFMRASLVYEKQMHVKLEIGSFAVYESIKGPEYIRSCEPTTTHTSFMRDKVQKLTNNKNENYPLPREGVVHMFTGCRDDEEGIAGLAYVGTICREGWNVGVDQIGTGSKYWYIFAHELGHNFNGRHSFEEGEGRTGGIMDYGDGKLDGVYQFNTKYRKRAMCFKLNERVNKCYGKFVMTDAPPGNQPDVPGRIGDPRRGGGGRRGPVVPLPPPGGRSGPGRRGPPPPPPPPPPAPAKPPPKSRRRRRTPKGVRRRRRRQTRRRRVVRRRRVKINGQDNELNEENADARQDDSRRRRRSEDDSRRRRRTR